MLATSAGWHAVKTRHTQWTSVLALVIADRRVSDKQVHTISYANEIIKVVRMANFRLNYIQLGSRSARFEINT